MAAQCFPDERTRLSPAALLPGGGGGFNGPGRGRCSVIECCNLDRHPSCHYNTVSPWELNLLTIVFIFLFHIFLIIFFNSKRQSGRRNPSRIYHFPIRSAALPPRPNNRNDLRLGTRLKGDREEGGRKKGKEGGGEREQRQTRERWRERGRREGRVQRSLLLIKTRNKNEVVIFTNGAQAVCTLTPPPIHPSIRPPPPPPRSSTLPW